MATETLRPDGDDTVGGWTTAPLFSKLNDQSDLAFITGVGVAVNGIVTFPTPAAIPASVTDFKVRVRLISSITNPNMDIHLSGTGGIPDLLITNHPDPESFVWYEANGDGTPLPSDLDDLKLNISKGSVGGVVDVTQVELVITYTPVPAVWAQDAEPAGSWAQDAEPAGSWVQD